MPPKGGLMYHITCLLYVPVPYLEKPKTLKIAIAQQQLIKGASFLRINKVTYILLVHNFCGSASRTVCG